MRAPRRRRRAPPARYGVDFDTTPIEIALNWGGDDVGRFGYHEFARTGDAAGRAELRIFQQQVLDAVEDVQSDEIVDGFRRPLERHTLLGAGRSLRVSQEATQSLTRACAMPLPRSSDESALFIPATCHSLVSR